MPLQQTPLKAQMQTTGFTSVQNKSPTFLLWIADLPEPKLLNCQLENFRHKTNQLEDVDSNGSRCPGPSLGENIKAKPQGTSEY